MRDNKWIWLDADGSFVDLYGVEGWLDDLINLRTRPYEVAKPLYNTWTLLNTLVLAKENGYSIGMISWLSKNPDVEYGKRVTRAKLNWLKRHDLDFIFDEILIVPYGTCKSDACEKYGCGNAILVDDEKPNRDAWKLGRTIDASSTNIIEELLRMI